MVALIFLYTLGAIFLFGGELNGTIIIAKRRRLHKEPKPEHLADVITMP
jgi:membrane protein